MAIYHFRMSNVSRSAGASSVAAVSYITARRMMDERTGQMHYGYGRRERVLAEGTELPAGAPSAYRDPAVLFNAVEAAATRKDARTAKKIVVALPREFSLEQDMEAVRRFVAEQVGARGYAATWAIHDDAGHNNPHAHIVIAARPIDAKSGRWAPLRSSRFVLDEQGRRIPVIDPTTGRQKTRANNRKVWVREDVVNDPLSRKDTLRDMREAWADVLNEHLSPMHRISAQSLDAQGIEREAAVHEGVAAREIERRGGTSTRMELNRTIHADNEQRAALRTQLDQVETQLTELRTRQAKDVLRSIVADRRRAILAEATGLRDRVLALVRRLAGALDRLATARTEARGRDWAAAEPLNTAAYNAGPQARNSRLRALLERARELALPIVHALSPLDWARMRDDDLAHTRRAVYEADPDLARARNDLDRRNDEVESLGGQRRDLPAEPWQYSGQASDPVIEPARVPMPDLPAPPTPRAAASRTVTDTTPSFEPRTTQTPQNAPQRPVSEFRGMVAHMFTQEPQTTPQEAAERPVEVSTATPPPRTEPMPAASDTPRATSRDALRAKFQQRAAELLDDQRQPLRHQEETLALDAVRIETRHGTVAGWIAPGTIDQHDISDGLAAWPLQGADYTAMPIGITVTVYEYPAGTLLTPIHPDDAGLLNADAIDAAITHDYGQIDIVSIERTDGRPLTVSAAHVTDRHPVALTPQEDDQIRFGTPNQDASVLVESAPHRHHRSR